MLETTNVTLKEFSHLLAFIKISTHIYFRCETILNIRKVGIVYWVNKKDCLK